MSAKKKPARKKAAPKKAAPKKAAPKKAAPKKAAPKKAAPKKAAPRKAAQRKPAAARAGAPAPVPEKTPAVPMPTVGPVLGAMFGRDVARLASTLKAVDWERMARYLVSYDWRNGHFSRLSWDGLLSPLDTRAVAEAKKSVAPALARAEIKTLARALRSVDWKSLAGTAPLGDIQWSGEVIELVVSLYNREKKEVICPLCRIPARDVFGRLHKMEREISGREVPLLCPYEGDGQHCPPDLSADSWTRLDDLTGQDGRSVRTDGLADRCITRSKLGIDISEIPEGGGCVVMTELERERIHVQHSGRVPAEPASSDGKLIVSLAGFRSTDVVQIVASGFYTEDDGPRRPLVVDWEMNETNSEVTFTAYDADGEMLTKESQFITIDWIAATR